MNLTGRRNGDMTTNPTVDTAERSDAELIALVRGGDVDAYGVLFERHRTSAIRLARTLTSAGDADDLASDAFSSVLRVLLNGGGPDVAFRPYLLTAVRRRHIDSIRARKRVQTTDEIDRFESGEPSADPVVSEFENEAAANAFRSLPERWQLVLWHMEVEDQKPAEIGVLLGMSANSISALAYRAREGLKQAYLQNHLADTADTECQWVTERLGAHVRKGLSKRDATKVDDHLDRCDRCSTLYLELVDVNSNLRGVIAPVVLGAAAAGYLASLHAGGAAGGLGLLAWLVRAGHVAKVHAGATAGVAASAAAAVTVGSVVVAHPLGHNHRPVADVPYQTSSTTSPGGPRGTSAVPPGSNPTKLSGRAKPKAAVVIPSVGATPTLLSALPSSDAPTSTDPTSPTTSTGTTGVTEPTTPTSPTTPDPGPSTVDVSLSVRHTITTNPHDHHVLIGALVVSTAAPATNLRLDLETTTGTFLLLRGAGWTCTGIGTGLATCETDSTGPAPFTLWIDQIPPVFEFQATVQAADNSDPDPTNNTFSFSGPGA
jgi:RNA polymerase sigma factor (sigma-70 family)